MNTLSSSSASCHRLHSWLPGLQSSAANARPPVMWHGTSSNHFSYASTRNVPRTPTIGPLWLRRSSVAVARFIGKRRSSTGRRPIGVLTHLGAPDFGLGTSSGQTSQGRRRVSAAAAGRISSHGRVDGFRSSGGGRGVRPVRYCALKSASTISSGVAVMPSAAHSSALLWIVRSPGATCAGVGHCQANFRRLSRVSPPCAECASNLYRFNCSLFYHRTVSL